MISFLERKSKKVSFGKKCDWSLKLFLPRFLKPSKLAIIFSDQNYRELSGFYKKSEGGQAGGDGMSLTKHVVIQIMHRGSLSYFHPLYFISMLMLNYVLHYVLAQKWCAIVLPLLIIQCLAWLCSFVMTSRCERWGKARGKKKAYVRETSKRCQGKCCIWRQWNPIFVAYCLLGVSYYAVLLSEWVNVTVESEPSTNSADFDPMFPDLWNFPGDGVFFRVFYNVVRYDILSSNRRIKLHAVRDCLFFYPWLCEVNLDALIIIKRCESLLVVRAYAPVYLPIFAHLQFTLGKAISLILGDYIIIPAKDLRCLKKTKRIVFPCVE